MKRLAIFAALLVAGSVGLLGRQEETLATVLAKAEARWQAKKPSAYQLTIEVGCFCPDLVRTPPSWRVINGEPHALQNLEPAARQIYGSYNTVEKLFAAIRRALSFGEYKIRVQYDPELGYPVMADLDPRREVEDEELVLKVTNFRPLPAR